MATKKKSIDKVINLTQLRMKLENRLEAAETMLAEAEYEIEICKEALDRLDDIEYTLDGL